MINIKAYDDKAMRKSTKLIAIICGLLLIIVAIYSKSIYAAIVGSVILMAIMLNKNTYASEVGIEIEYNATIFKHYSVWEFSEITEIHIEKAPDPKFCILHFMRGVMSRRLVFYKGDSDKVIKLAIEKNPHIHVANVWE